MYTLGKLTLEARHGTIVEVPADAWVVPLPEDLTRDLSGVAAAGAEAWGGTGRFREAASAAARVLSDDLPRTHQAFFLARDPGAGGGAALPEEFRGVIGMFPPDCVGTWDSKLGERLYKGYMAVLRVAEDEGLTSLAVPALGAGGCRCPFDASVATFARAAMDVSVAVKHVRRLIFVAHDEVRCVEVDRMLRDFIEVDIFFTED